MKKLITSFFEVLACILCIAAVFAGITYSARGNDPKVEDKTVVTTPAIVEPTTTSGANVYQDLVQAHGVSTGYVLTTSGAWYLSQAQATELSVDASTFSVLPSQPTKWAKDATTVYYRGTALLELDASTLTILDANFVKDNFGVYSTLNDSIQLLPAADPATFTIVGTAGTYAKDDNHVWYSNDSTLQEVQSVHAKNFTRIQEPYYTDGANIIVLGAVMPQVRVDRFAPVAAITTENCTNYFSRDHKNVYQTNANGTSVLAFASPKEFAITSVSAAQDLYIARDQDTVFMGPCRLQKIKGLRNMFTARILTGAIVQDLGGVYTIKGGLATRVPTIDVASFRSVGGGYFADASAVYYSNGAQIERLPAVEPKSATVSVPYAYNGSVVYCSGRQMTVDAASFTVLAPHFAVDATAVYNNCEPLSIIQDIHSFTILGPKHGKDAMHLYAFDQQNNQAYIVNIADVESYEVIDEYFGRDAQYLYFTPYNSFEYFIVVGANPLRFITNGKGIGIDDTGTYDEFSAMIPVELLTE